jgi:hypothetical protein
VFLISLLLALIVGPLTALTETILWMHGAHKYNPPITEAEWQKLLQLPAAKLGFALVGREVRFTRMQWLRESVGYSYFWKGLAKSSLVPTVGVFLRAFPLVVLKIVAPWLTTPASPAETPD